MVWLLTVAMVAACGASDEQRALAQKATAAVNACKELGDQPVRRHDNVLVWDAEGNNLHRAHDLVDGSKRYRTGTDPVTVFVIGAKRSVQMGTYSISGQPAYREWVDVCVVDFVDSAAVGTPVSMHEVVSLDPRQSRPVRQAPEHGDPAPPIAEWIGTLPVGR